MKFKLLFSLFFFLLLNVGFAQINVNWSKLELSKSTIAQSVFFDNHIYIVKIDENGFSFAKKNKTHFIKYNMDMEEVGSSIINLNYESNRAVFQKLLVIDNKLIIASLVRTSLKDQKIVLSELDKSTLELVGEKTEIHKTTAKKIFAKAKFYVEQSPDKNWTLIVAKLKVKAKEPKKFQFLLVNKDMERVVEKNLILQKTGKNFHYKLSKVDNDGNIFMLGTQQSFRSESGNSTSMFWRYLKEHDEKELFYIKSPRSKNIKSLTFELKGDSIYFGGYYSKIEGNKKNSAGGILFSAITKEWDDNIELEDYPFSNKILSLNISKAKQRLFSKKKKTLEISGLNIKHVIPWVNSNSILVGEVEYISSGNGVKYGADGSLDNVGVDPNLRSVVENVIVSCVDLEGEILWSVLIEKKQVRESWFRRDSYMLDSNDESIKVFYNNSQKNDLPKGMVMTSINESGKPDNQLVSKKKTKVQACPRYCIKLEDNKYFIYSRNWLKNKSGILTMK